jgi:hypothetical protein
MVTSEMEIKNAITIKSIKMINKDKEINAYLFWQYLDKNGRCSTNELRKQLRMNDEEFLMALDRLLRKNKIVFNVRGKTGFVEQNYY